MDSFHVFSNANSLPTIPESIKRLKDDITFEKQYTDLIDLDLVPATDIAYQNVKQILDSNKFEDSAEFRALGCFVGEICEKYFV